MTKDSIRLLPTDHLASLRSTFPDVWADILAVADPDSSFLVYAAFAETLLQRRGDTDLWRRAYQFFDRLATDSTAEFGLSGAFERLCDSDLADIIERNLGAPARVIFQNCKLGA